jgi:hypothetical protein
MSRLGTPGPGMQAPGESDVYTVLMVAATVALLAALVYVSYRALSLFETLLPPGGS